MKGLLLKIDIEEAFNFVNHSFLSTVLENFGLNQVFLKRISAILQNQELWVINAGRTYFELTFYFCSRNSFPFYQKKNVNSLSIFNQQFSFISYTDDITFFSKICKGGSVNFQHFSHFPD